MCVLSLCGLRSTIGTTAGTGSISSPARAGVSVYVCLRGEGVHGVYVCIDVWGSEGAVVCMWYVWCAWWRGVCGAAVCVRRVALRG